MKKLLQTFFLTQALILLTGWGQLFTFEAQGHNNSTLTASTYSLQQLIDINELDLSGDQLIISLPNADREAPKVSHSIDTIEENEEEDLLSEGKKLSCASKYIISYFYAEEIGISYRLLNIFEPCYQLLNTGLEHRLFVLFEDFRL